MLRRNLLVSCQTAKRNGYGNICLVINERIRLGLRTRPCSQVADIADQIVGDRVDHEEVLHPGHQIAHQNSLGMHNALFETNAGHIVALANVFRPKVVRVLHWPPLDDVSLDAAFGPRPFQSHVRGIDDRRDI